MNTVKLRGKNYPCYMTMGAMRRFKRMHGVDLAAGEQPAAGDMVDFMYCMTSAACAAESVPFDIDAETFADCITSEQFAEWSQSLASDEQKKTTAQA